MRRSRARNELFLSALPALALAISCIASPARASPESRAETTRTEQSRRAAEPGDELMLLVGLSGTLVSHIGTGGTSYGLDGYSALIGQRHGRWLTSELRGDVLWDAAALSGSVQAALAYDPGGRLTPVFGAWVGYRGTAVELETPRGRVTETVAHDALLGLEVGGRLRYGPLIGELMAQGATAPWSSRETSGLENGRASGAEPVRFGDIAELSLAARVGLSF